MHSMAPLSEMQPLPFDNCAKPYYDYGFILIDCAALALVIY